MNIVGIDPGLSGAIACLSGDHLDVCDMPTLMLTRGGKKRRELDAHLLADQLQRLSATHVFLEQAWARPGEAASVSFTNGRSFGVVLGILAALEIPYGLISPQRWKSTLHVPAAKDGARARASQLMPQWASNWRRVKDDGRAEASLIALFGLRSLEK